MNLSALYNRTTKGVRAVSSKSKSLPSQSMRVLSHIDGQSPLESILASVGKLTEPKLYEIITQLSNEGYIKEITKDSLFSPSQFEIRTPIEVAEISAEEFLTAAAEVEGDSVKKAQELQEAEARAKTHAEEQARLDAAEINVDEYLTATAEVEDESAKRARELKEAEARAKAYAVEQERLAAAAREREKSEQLLLSTVDLLAKSVDNIDMERPASKEETPIQTKPPAIDTIKPEAGTNDMATRQARIIAEQKASDETAARAKIEAEEKARIDAQIKAEIKTRIEAERKALEEAETRAKQETTAYAKREAEEKARIKAERRAREEAEAQAKREREAHAKREAEEKARVEAEIKAREKALREEAEAQAMREAEAKARIEAEEKAREEALRKAREEAEAQARREAEEKARIEAERRAREEAEARAKQEAEARAKREAEEKARIEAELKAREEALRKAREEAEEKARQKAEEKARIEAERKAREEAKARAKAEAKEKAKAEAERKAHEAAEARAKREVEEQARLEAKRLAREARNKLEAEEKARADAECKALEQAKAEKKAEAKLQANREAALRAQAKAEEKARKKEAQGPIDIYKWLRPVISVVKTTLISLLAVALLLLVLAQLINLSMLINPIQKLASESVQEPVTIQSIHASLWPQPHLVLSDVSIGESANIKASNISVSPVLSSIFSPIKTLKSIEIEALTLDQDNVTRPLGWITSSNKLGKLKVGQIYLNKTSIKTPDWDVPSFNADIKLDDAGNFKNATVSNDDHHLSVVITPQNDGYEINLTAEDWKAPLGPAVVFDELSAHGTASRGQANLSQVEGRLYGGFIKAQVNVNWTDLWSTTGSFQLAKINLENITPVFSEHASLKGRLNANGTFSMKANGLSKLITAPDIRANFKAVDGHVGRINLLHTMQLASNDLADNGSTRFDSLSGSLILKDGHYQFRQLALQAGQLKAIGEADIQSNQNISGKIHTELSMKSRQLQSNSTLSGTLGNPSLH